MLIHDCLVQPIRAVVISIGDRAWYREHWVERQGETLTTAREAGTPTRLVRSNPLFCGALIGPDAELILVPLAATPTIKSPPARV
jgi:hypothetical protein